MLDEDQGWQAESASKGSFVAVEFGGKPCLPSIAILKIPTGHSNDCRSHTTSGDFIGIPGRRRLLNRVKDYAYDAVNIDYPAPTSPSIAHKPVSPSATSKVISRKCLRWRGW
ncbi:MAG: hypothetical protein WBD11_15980 [Xanthobacteraceae bacterium]